MGKHTVSLRIVRLSTQKAEIFGDTVPCSPREVVGVWVNIQLSHMVSVEICSLQRLNLPCAFQLTRSKITGSGPKGQKEWSGKK
jgi:hypothetical protein